MHRTSQRWRYLRLCWMPALGNCPCSSWAEEIPALSSPSFCAPLRGPRRSGLGTSRRSWSLEGRSPGVSSQAAPNPRHRCPRCPAALLWGSLGAHSWNWRDQGLRYSNLQWFNYQIMSGMIWECEVFQALPSKRKKKKNCCCFPHIMCWRRFL